MEHSDGISYIATLVLRNVTSCGRDTSCGNLISWKFYSLWKCHEWKQATVTTLKHLNLAVSIFIKLCEKRLITKECIVTDMHLNFAFKQALHFSKLVIKLY